MNKINQIKTTTDRVLSPLSVNTSFLYHVWHKLLNNNVNGLTYTQKEFIKHILKTIIIIRQDTNLVGISIVDIQMHISNYIFTLHSVANLKFNNIAELSRINNFNPVMVNPKSGQLRIQKFIRLACKYILTERDIRKETKHWEAVCGNTINNTDIDRGFCRYWSKKILLFQYRLYDTLSKNAQQIVHLAEQKQYKLSRQEKICNDFSLYRTRSSSISIHEKPIRKGDDYSTVIGYDSHMLKYLSYANVFNQQPNVNRLLSESLLQDISNALYNASNNCPEKIKSDKKRYAEYKFNLRLMHEFALHSSRIPAMQNLDRHFTINKDGNMSYTPAKKPTYLTSNGNWLSGADRMITKFGKGVRKLYATYPDKIEETILEYICNHLKSKHTFMAKLEVVEGEELRRWYHEDTYNRSVNTSTLGSSCMRYPKCQPYLDLYVENPDKIKMLIAHDDDGLIGRALLWYEDNGNKAFIDRIYGNDKTQAACKSWAAKNGFMTKSYQSYKDKGNFVTATGQLVSKQFIVTLERPTSGKFPYADTMHQMIIKDDKLQVTNVHSPEFKNCFVLDSTGGILYGYDTGTPLPASNSQGGEISDDDDEMVIFADGQEVPLEDCSFCEHDECYYHSDDCYYVEADDCCYHADYIYWVGDYAYYTEGDYDDHVWSECEQAYLWTDDSTSFCNEDNNHIDYAPCDDVRYCEYDGVHYHEEDAFYCDVMEDYCHNNNTINIEYNDEVYEVANWCTYEDVAEHYQN